jgi:pimeloyl-ACP methyl ester carboxylesterase
MSTIVLVHAFGSSSRAWTPQLRALSDRYRVLAPDLPSHGDADGPFTLDRAPILVRGLAGMYSGGRAEHAQAAAEDFRRCGKRTFLAGLRELAGLDLRPRLSQVGVPTLVLCGSKDRVNIPLSRELAAGIPTAELRIVPGATHLWNLQQPETFNHTITAFVDKSDISRSLRTTTTDHAPRRGCDRRVRASDGRRGRGRTR